MYDKVRLLPENKIDFSMKASPKNSWYGDIYPVTDAGRIIAMISAIVGIAIIALPAGIITAGYIEEINKN